MRYPSGVCLREFVQARPGLPRRALSLARVGWGLCIDSGPDEGVPRQMQAGRHMVANRHDLPAQPKGEKFPVNFLLFTERPDFALPQVVLAMTNRRACPFGQTTREGRELRLVLAERTQGIKTDTEQPQAAWCVRLVTSPRPANSSGTEISSSISSQCRPTRVSSTRARCAGLASRRRGNHASGTPSVRPSLSSTHIVCASKCTDMAERSMRALSAAPRGAAAGVAFQAGAAAHQGEIAAFAAGFALVALGLGLGALLGRDHACLRPPLGDGQGVLLLELLRGRKLLLGLRFERHAA